MMRTEVFVQLPLLAEYAGMHLVMLMVFAIMLPL